jgi:hypothetical protein
MATLLRYKPDGAKRTHTCDARCYNAKGTDCHCFCNGKNHGKGFEHAINMIKANIDTIKSLGITVAKAVEDAIKLLKGGY